MVGDKTVKLWHDDDDFYDDDDEIIEWYDGYQKRKAQKEQIKKELMLIAWHSSRWLDWFNFRGQVKTDRKIVKIADSCFKFI